MRLGASIVDMCESNIPGPPINLKHKFVQLQPLSAEKKDVSTCLIQEGESITLTCDVVSHLKYM